MKLFKTFFSLAVLAGATALASAAEDFNVLVFSKTNGFRHKDAIEVGVPFFKKQGELHNFKVDATEDVSAFTEDNLKKYSAIVLLCTTGDFLTNKPAKNASPEEKQKEKADSLLRREAFRKYVENGGGIVGLHAATDGFWQGSAAWPEFQKIIGGAFQHHPQHQTSTINIVDKAHPTVKHLVAKGDTWIAFDEWYNFQLLQKDNHVILTVDDSTCKGAKVSLYAPVIKEDGEKFVEKATIHPFAWTRSYGKGKVFYTSRGHFGSAFGEPDYAQHVIAGLFWTLGKPAPEVNPESLPKVKPPKKK
ncbi:MAG: ThuA domain-containing protein [Puniceicoccales bacterium]|nr:ThuA domain-containing protein [Puniceicoccales bacterium]